MNLTLKYSLLKEDNQILRNITKYLLYCIFFKHHSAGHKEKKGYVVMSHCLHSQSLKLHKTFQKIAN